MVLTGSFVLSPVTGLFCHRRLADFWCISTRLGGCISAKLDASVGASGPHDFAVREKRLSSARRLTAHKTILMDSPCSHLTRPTPPRPPHPVPYVRDDRETPLCGTGWGDIEVIWVSQEWKSFCGQGWTAQITLIRFNKSPCARKAR
jgi:hypothetical protein